MVLAWLIAFPQAGFSASAYDSNATANERLQSLFDNLQIAGDAYNGGGTGAARNALIGSGCSALSGSSAVNDFFADQLLFTKDGGFLGTMLAEQGQQGLASAMSGACSALSGQGSVMSGGSMLSQSGNGIVQSLVAAGQKMANGSNLPFLKRLEVETALEREQVVSTITTIQPLWVDATKTDHVFTQLSWRRIEGHDTANAGLVWRHLNDAKTMMWGLNTFFDHGFERNHNRMSIGADFRTSQLGISANRYLPLSDWRSVDLYIEERAAAGWDLELNGQIPQLPSWTAAVKGYTWSGQEHVSNEIALGKTNTYGVVSTLEYSPVSAFAIRGGVRNETASAPSLELALRFNIRLDQPIDWQIKPRQRLASLEERVYDKVSRENTIRVEQRRKSSAVLTVLQTVGANTINGQPGILPLTMGQSLIIPATLTVANSVGAVVRLQFNDGAILTAGQDTEVLIEANRITLVHGVVQYTSGGVTRMINVPGATIQLLGTDIDLVSNGTTSSVRVRDGTIRFVGTATGALTVDVGELAQTIGGTASPIVPNTPAADAHTDRVSVQIDRPAVAVAGMKVAPYPIDPPRILSAGTNLGDTVVIGLKFNTVVTVSGGTPRLSLTINGIPRTAPLTSGSGTDDLAFTYTLQVGDSGATSLTVTALDANGAMIEDADNKSAVTSVADTVLPLSVTAADTTPPSGYGVSFTTDPVTNLNQTAVALSFTSAEVGSIYNYTISSSGGGTNVTGTGTIATATQSVTGINVSGLGDGTLTVSLTLTDTASNVGTAATDTVNKGTVATLTMDFIGNSYSLNGTTYNSLASFLTASGGTFSRSSTARYFNSSGVMQTAASGTPRFDYDPVTLAAKGLLIEEQRTNLILYSNSFKTAPWNSTTCVLAGGFIDSGTTTVAPDGNNVPFYNVSTTDCLFQDVTVTTGQPVTHTVWIKGNKSATIGFRTPGTASTTATSFNITTQWQRIRLTTTSASASTSRFLIDNRAVNGYGTTGLQLALFGAQVEQGGPFPTSYIPTTSGSATRTADDLRIPTGVWFSSSAGTLAATGSMPYLGSTTRYPGLAALTDGNGNGNNDIGLFIADGGADSRAAEIHTGGVQVFLNAASAYTPGNTLRSVISYRANDAIAAFDGTLGTQDNSLTLPTIARLTVGRRRGEFDPIDGWIAQVSYYPARLSNATVQSLSTP